MGCCCSSDATPDVPQNIIPDPDVNTTIKVVTRKLGMFSRDYSVHEGEYPKDSTEAKEKMWMWINKSNGGIFFSLIFVHPSWTD